VAGVWKAILADLRFFGRDRGEIWVGPTNGVFRRRIPRSARQGGRVEKEPSLVGQLSHSTVAIAVGGSAGTEIPKFAIGAV